MSDPIVKGAIWRPEVRNGSSARLHKGLVTPIDLALLGTQRHARQVRMTPGVVPEFKPSVEGLLNKIGIGVEGVPTKKEGGMERI